MKHRLLWIAVPLLLATVGFVGWRAFGSRWPGRAVSPATIAEVTLGALPEGGVALDVPLVSADLRHVALRMRRGDAEHVWFDGDLGRAYPRVRSLTLTRDERQVAYLARRDKQQAVVIGTREGAWYDRIAYLSKWQSPDAPEARDRGIPYVLDGAHYAYVARKGRDTLVIIDGKPGPAFDSIGGRWATEDRYSGVQISPDGQHVGYVGYRGRKACLMVDGVQQAGWYEGAVLQLDDNREDDDEPFVPAKARYAAMVQVGGVWSLVVNGEEHAGRTRNRPTLYTVPADGGIAYAHTTTEDQGTRFVFRGQAHGPYRAIDGGPFFSPDGRHFALVTGEVPPGMPNVRQCRLVVDGVPGPIYDRIYLAEASADGKHWAYYARRDGKTYFVVDGQERPARGGTPNVITFSPDGNRVAYVAWYHKPRDRGSVVIDDVEGPIINAEIKWLSFTPDGLHVVYVATEEGEHKEILRKRVYLDHVAGPTFAQVHDPVLAPRGARSAYIGEWTDGTRTVVLDGVPGAPYAEVAGLRFSDDGARALYIATRAAGGQCVVLNGREGPWYDEVRAALFSPDSRHVAAAVRQGASWQVLLDGQPLATFDDPTDAPLREVYRHLKYTDADTLVTLGMRERAMVRVELRGQ